MSPLSGDRVRVILGLCLLAALCEGFDLQAAAVCGSGIAHEFSPTANELGTLFSASTLGTLLSVLVAGRLADAIGRTRTLLAGAVVFGLASLASAAAWDIASLSWMRLLTGVGIGAVLPNVVTLVNESSPSDRRSANVLLVYVGLPLGACGVSIASMLSAPEHWRAIFIAGGIAPLLVALVAWQALPESPAFVLLREAPAAARAGEAAGMGAIFTDGRGPLTMLLWLSFFLGWLVLYVFVSWLPLLLIGSGFSHTEAAATQAVFNGGGAIASFAGAPLLEGQRRAPTILTIFVSVPALVLLLATAPLDLYLVAPIVLALGCAVVVAQGFLYTMAPRCYPTAMRGFGVGAAVALGRLGAVVGPKLAGALQAAGHTLPHLLRDILPLAVLGSLSAVALSWQAQRVARERPPQ